jgi:23S rRNA (adenine2030-N6)-methyltransferase
LAVNYRHAFHAGNFADVVKHLALCDVLLHLKKKDKPFFVLDTHAGCGLYDLQAEESSRTGEAARGIEKLQPLFGRSDLPQAMRAYFDCVTAAGYPGSPLIAARLLRSNDRLVAIEKQEAEFASLKRVLAPFRNAKAIEADGYERIAALLPPQERRGLVLIDPPYEAPDEFERAATASATAYRRFATGIYMLWFPIKSPAAADAFCGEVLACGATKVLRIDVSVPAVTGDDKERLSAAGLLIVNPPFETEARMKACGEIIGPLLEARLSIAWLAGEDG